MIYYPIQTANQLKDYGEDNTPLTAEILGFIVLFFVVFCAIWAIPETTFPKTHRRTAKAENDYTEKQKENIDKMIEKGYVLNTESGEWEKPKD